MDCRKNELSAKIREHRLRLDDTLATLDERLAVISQVPAKVAKVARFGRGLAALVGVVTVLTASVIFIHDLFVPRRKSRRN